MNRYLVGDWTAADLLFVSVVGAFLVGIVCAAVRSKEDRRGS